MESISSHVSYSEAVKSPTAYRYGIKNKPNTQQLTSMKRLSERLFEPLRTGLGNKIIGISSFFRSPTLNKKIGGSKNSKHCKGQAMDIDADIYGGLSNLDIFNYIKNNLIFDQLIWEFENPDGSPAWVHVSYKKHGNRNQVLKSFIEEDEIKYKIIPHLPTCHTEPVEVSP